MITQRQPDLTVHKTCDHDDENECPCKRKRPMDIWVLRAGEVIPRGFGHTTTDDGVTLVFRPKPRKEKHDELPIH